MKVCFYQWLGRITIAIASIMFTTVPLHALSVEDPNDLPPLGGPGWYSLKGTSVSYYVNYPGVFEGILFAAKDIIIDNFSGVASHFDGNDQILSFDANLTATVTKLIDDAVVESFVTVRGTMSVRLANKLGHTTGTFPLTLESMSFTMLRRDLFSDGNAEPFLSIQAPASPASTGQMVIRDLGGGKFENTTTIDVHSEAAHYNRNTFSYRTFFPDTNRPMRYELRSLQGPALDFSLIDNPAKDVELKFTMRRYVRYTAWWSDDLTEWELLSTRETNDPFGVEFTLTVGGGHSGKRGYMRVRTELIAPSPP